VLLLAVACSSGPALGPGGVARVSGDMPVVSGPSLLGGKDFSSDDHEGDVLVVNFWNPYCAPCRKETPLLELAWGKLRKDGVTIVGVLFSNDAFPHDLDAARRFEREFGVLYPSMDDPQGVVAAELGVPGIPTTVIADARGQKRYKVFGALKKGQLENLVERISS
jgi:thiol-disulfide isomerase/thioredoxin